MSRNPPTFQLLDDAAGVPWLKADISVDSIDFGGDEILIHLAPIWALEPLLQNASGQPRRLIAFGSTSRFTKEHSSSEIERALARRLADGERGLLNLADRHGIAWTLFRPTLIYGAGLDANVSKLARTIIRSRALPLPTRSLGKRMPVHASDLAKACVDALKHPSSEGKAYNLAGGETISYREMVNRIFVGVGLKPRIVLIPEFAVVTALRVLSVFPIMKRLKPEVLLRMRDDLVFDSTTARTDFGFAPRPFRPTKEDLGVT